MAAKKTLMGMTGAQQVNPERLSVDIRPMGTRLFAWLASPSNMTVIFFMMTGICVFYPMYGDYILMVAALLSLYAFSRKEAVPLKMPKQSRMPDPKDPNPGTGAPGPADGIFYLGNDIDSGKELWITNSDARQHFLVLGTTGAGKSVPNDGLVHTPTGWRTMGSLHVGDLVSTPDGRSAPITGYYPQGELEICRVLFEDGRSAEVCPEHLWEIHHKHWVGRYRPGMSRAGAAKPRLLTTAQLAEQLMHSKGAFHVRLPAAVEKPTAHLAIDPYLLGVMLGDGNMTGEGLRFSSVDAESLEAVGAALPAGLELHQYQGNAKADWNIRFRKGERRLLNPLKADLQALGLHGLGSGQKFIPVIYKEASIAQRWALVQGLMDTDGSCDARKPSLSYCTSSERLACDFAEIVRSLGGIARVSPPRETSYTHAGQRRIGKRSWRVAVRHPEPSAFFSLPRKVTLADRPYQYAGSLKLRVIGVERCVRRAEASCILVDHPDHLFITNNYVVTHNTENLIGFAANALTWGSGLLFCDGKGDVSLFAKMFAMTRRFGREDDLLVLNFMTGGRDLEGGNGEVLSHTINPFATGASDYLTQMVVSLMDDAGGDGAMWKGRATAMLSGVIKALVFLRDRGHIDMNVGVIRDHMALKRIISLCDPAQYPDMSGEIREMIRSYLTSLPGYQEDKKEKQAQTTLDQHGYLEMQFTKIFSSLASVYKHIFFTPYGQVDMMDVVLNRRILVVMLPALEKSGDELENLGKIVVANLKGMMGATLGSSLEGTWRKVVDNRATNSPSPFLCILDEVGYYTVDGLALMAAQARSLGFSMVYASQDIPAMKRRNEKEAASIIANTNTKIFMRTEEAKETGALAVEAADKGTRVRIGGFERRIGDLAGANYGMGEGTNYEDVNRVSYSDLKGQGAGEMHVLFQNELVRAKSFYADPASSLDQNKLKLRANHFIEIRRPDAAAIEIANQIPEVVRRLMDPANRELLVSEADRAIRELDDAFVASDDMAIVATVMNRMLERKRPPLEAACAGVGDVINRLKVATTTFAGQAKAARGNHPSFPQAVPGGPDDIGEEDLDDDGLQSLPGERITAPVVPPQRANTAPPKRPAAKVDRSVPHEVEIEGRRPDPVASNRSSNDALLRSLAALDFDDDMEPGVVEARLDEAMGAPSAPDTEKVSPERIAQVVNTFDRSAAAAGIEEASGGESDASSGGDTMFVTDFLEALLDDKDGGGTA